jgi:hypothetical protein
MILMGGAKRGRRHRSDETGADFIRPFPTAQRPEVGQRQKHAKSLKAWMAEFVLILSDAWLSGLSIGI